MDRAGGTDPRPEAVARRLADAVEDLVELWTSAGRSVVPRLSAQQLKALKAVARRPAATLTDLAESVGTTLPAASRLCDRLEAAGLLQRIPHSHSRRALSLLLTPQGRRVLAEIGARRTLDLAAVLAAMTPLQRASLEDGLRAFRAARGATAADRRTDE
ncbi:MarR family winged helix-turn-helix transcriptional regulator [Streptomyces sp. NPDC021080]|uniref:MarR family winged helix-turn-helix transcriptional regulator n=1 Tax=Streptomyces sp. NPDC021080 TaxID=3365110 RepID=UPI003793E392